MTVDATTRLRRQMFILPPEVTLRSVGIQAAAALSPQAAVSQVTHTCVMPVDVEIFRHSFATIDAMLKPSRNTRL